MVVYQNDIINAIVNAKTIRGLVNADIWDNWQQGGDATPEQQKSMILLTQWIGVLRDATELLEDGCLDSDDIWNVIQAINEQSIGLDCNSSSTGNSGSSSGGGGGNPPAPIDECCLFDSNRIVTSTIIIGKNYGETTIKGLLEKILYSAIPPTCSLTGGGTREFGSSNSVTLNWSVTAGTLPITGITVNGVEISPTGGNQSGSVVVACPQDVTTVFNMSTTDGTTIASANTTVYWDLYNWYGSTASAPTTSANVRALGGNTFNNTFTINSGTTNLYFSFWIPTGTTLVSVLNQDASNLDITADFVSSALSVNDAGGTPRTGTLYVKTNGVPYISNQRLNVTVS